MMLPRLSDVMMLMKRPSDSIVTFGNTIFCHENHDLSVIYMLVILSGALHT